VQVSAPLAWTTLAVTMHADGRSEVRIAGASPFPRHWLYGNGGELIAKSKIDEPSKFTVGDRVFHIKFGNGNIAGIEGNKLTIEFDRAGQKRVLDGFVERV
jgi:hypothetical protein